MKELDLLKKDWKKSENSFVPVSENEIYKMIHKRSSSIVKWIFYVSIIELGLGFVLGLVLSFTKNDGKSIDYIKSVGLYSQYVTISVVLYIVIFFFIYRFYTMYRKISVVDNTKQLISTIIKTRKVVKQYIAFNLTSFALLFIVLSSYLFYQKYMEEMVKKGIVNPEMPIGTALISFSVLVLVTALFTFIFWLIYKMIYGILLKRLEKNYLELKRIDL
jgi:hypothetical protein